MRDHRPHFGGSRKLTCTGRGVDSGVQRVRVSGLGVLGF